MAKDVNKRIKRLRDEIREHDYLYYVLNRPKIRDRQYDELFAELKALEEANPQLTTPDSPTQRVSDQPLEDFDNIRHAVPMLSMDNTYNADELRAFDERIRKQLDSPDYDYAVEPKIDGLAISLRYEKGEFKTAATRGDGQVGDNVTANVRTIRAVPLALLGGAEVPAVLEVRGEVYMPISSFAELNRLRTEAGEPTFANPRNAAAGSLKLLDARITSARNLSFFAYATGDLSEPIAGDHCEMFQKLREFGLPVSPNIIRANNVDEALDICFRWSEKRSELDYQIDGMVIKINRFEQQEILGATGRAPRWCISYKFAAEQAETTVESIDVQVGKSGILTPVANLAPVQLAGTTVKRASLHNFDELKRLGVRCGDTVVIEKAGEIIPQVLEVKKQLRPAGTRAFKPPKKCPNCGSAVARDKDGVYIRCVNKSCTGQLKERLKYFAGRGQMDIENLGEALIDQLVDASLVKNFADIYKLQKDDLLELERMADKSAQNVIDSIKASKTRPLWRLVAGLGIRHIGVQTAQDLAEHFGSLDKLRNATFEELKKALTVTDDPKYPKTIYEYMNNLENKEVIRIAVNKHRDHSLWMFIKELGIKKIAEKTLKNIAEKFDSIDDFLSATSDLENLKKRLSKKIVPQSVYDYFRDNRNCLVIDQLIDVGIQLQKPKQKSSNLLDGKTIVVTGLLENFTRSQIERLIKDNGGKVSSSVSKKTSFVVVGEDPGSKLDKARQLQVKVIDEKQFLKMINTD